MKISLIGFLTLGLVCLGCGDDDGPILGDGGADTSTRDDGGGVDGGGDDDGGGVDGGGVDGGGDDGGGVDGGGDDGGGDDAGPGACRDNSTCEDSEYCAASSSGSVMRCDAPGMCESRPELCTDEVDPVCGCDGEDYSNACEAARAGSRVAAEGMCPTTACELSSRDGCCFTDTDCGDRGVCRSAACVARGEGTCVAPPDDGECWVHSDCADGMRCRGANQCPCGAACLVPDSPGTCVSPSDA